VDFTKGQIIFTISFVVVFIAGLVWSYRKDKIINTQHFKGVALKLIITIIGLYSLIFLILKLMH